MISSLGCQLALIYFGTLYGVRPLFKIWWPDRLEKLRLCLIFFFLVDSVYWDWACLLVVVAVVAVDAVVAAGHLQNLQTFLVTKLFGDKTFSEMCLWVLVLPVFIVCYGIAKCKKRNNKGKYNVPLFNEQWFGLWPNEIVCTILVKTSSLEVDLVGTTWWFWWDLIDLEGEKQ